VTNYQFEKFPKKITIKWKQLYRYLAQYAQENAKDVLTAKFATAAYVQNDTAKMVIHTLLLNL